MTANFVTFYLIIVLITGPFFQYLPVATFLKWDEVLLAKVLNQAPTVFLLGYLAFPLTKAKQISTYLLILFLISCIIPEIYHYIIHPDNQFVVIVSNNIVSYCIIGWIFLGQKTPFDKISKNVWITAIGFFLLTILSFSFSAVKIFQHYLPNRPFGFLVVITFMIIASLLVFFSFFTASPFKRAWYEIVGGIILLVVVDIYVYSSFFIYNGPPEHLFTYGKVLFSVGLLLLVDGISRQRKNILSKPQLY
jgi:hypothetical protein